MNRPKVGIQPERTVEITAIRSVDEESRRVTVSFSSEQPVSRWFGAEILQHDDGNISFDRLNNIGVTLFNHDRSYVLGKVENARLDPNEKKTYADLVFDTDPEADLIFQKVQNGTLKGVSVGYSVDVWEEVVTNKTSSNGRFTGPCYIATKWTPLEISIVSVPADDSVGVGRGFEENEPVPAVGRTDSTKTEEEENMQRGIKTPYFSPDGTGGAGEEGQERSQVDIIKEREAAMKAERQRAGDITTMCREFDVDPAEYIDNGSSVDQVRAAILEKMKREMKPLSSGADIRIEIEETDKIREAASDAILLRGGKLIEKPAAGAKEYRSLSLRELAVDCLLREGKANARKLDNDTLFREALSPNSQFSAILSNAVNKTMSIAYMAAAPTFQQWCGRGSNPNFKPSTHYQISEAGDLIRMTQSGEFKFDEMSDNGVSKALATFGREFGMTRQALIDDDIGVLTKVPERYVRAASRGINKLVYQMLGNNPSIYDGVTLFNASHNNVGVAGEIATTTVSKAREAMRTQKSLRGKETLNIAPKFLIVPAAQETAAKRFLSSTSDIELNNPGIANIFKDSLIPIVDAELDAYSTSAYYFAASPADIDTIEVTYLNGDDMPKLESKVGFDYLGIKWRIFIDYGVTVLDYRGLYKNDGV